VIGAGAVPLGVPARLGRPAPGACAAACRVALDDQAPGHLGVQGAGELVGPGLGRRGEGGRLVLGQVGDDGATGFIKRTDLGRDRDEQRPERFQVGQKFDALVIGFDRSKKPNFSIKALQIHEEKQAVAQYGSSDSGASLGDILGEALKNKAKD
jgi:hypothetical protein